MSGPVTIIRASSLTGYADCPRRAAARLFRDDVAAMGYMLRTTPGSIGAAVGTAVHAGAAMMLDEKARTGALPPDDAVSDCAVQSLRDSAAETEFVCDRETPTVAAAERQVIRMADVYRRDIAPTVNPMIVEERLEAEVVPGLVLSGQADVIAREPGRVRDLKTGKNLGRHGPQIGSYSLLARSNGLAVAECGVDFIRRVAATKPQPAAVTASYDVALAETAAVNVLMRMAADLATFRRGDAGHRLVAGDPWAFLANPSSMLCADKWCPAWGTDFCREHTTKED